MEIGENENRKIQNSWSSKKAGGVLFWFSEYGDVRGPLSTLCRFMYPTPPLTSSLCFPIRKFDLVRAGRAFLLRKGKLAAAVAAIYSSSSATGKRDTTRWKAVHRTRVTLACYLTVLRWGEKTKGNGSAGRKAAMGDRDSPSSCLFISDLPSDTTEKARNGVPRTLFSSSISMAVLCALSCSPVADRLPRRKRRLTARPVCSYVTVG